MSEVIVLALSKSLVAFMFVYFYKTSVNPECFATNHTISLQK